MKTRIEFTTYMYVQCWALEIKSRSICIKCVILITSCICSASRIMHSNLIHLHVPWYMYLFQKFCDEKNHINYEHKSFKESFKRKGGFIPYKSLEMTLAREEMVPLSINCLIPCWDPANIFRTSNASLTMFSDSSLLLSMTGKTQFTAT